MRVLPSLIGIEAVVLVLLLGVWWSRQAEVALPHVGDRAVGVADAGPGAPEAAGVDRAQGASASSERREVVVSDGGALAGQQVILQGRLLTSTAFPEMDSIRMSMRRQGTWRSAEISAAGGYAVCDLSPGTWRVTCEVPGFRRLDFEHTLTGAAIQRLDIELQAAVVLPVSIRTTDGKRLQAELTKTGLWQGLGIVITAAALVGDFEPTENSSLSIAGVGRHRKSGDLNQLAEPDGDDGVLELDQPPPVYAAVLLRHTVLAQQRIDPGQTEVHFVIDLAEVERRYAKVRLRLVGPNGPIAKAMIRLSTAQGGGHGGRTDENGVAVIDKVLPGLASFDVMSPDSERYSTHLTVEPGADLDLGDIVLTAPGKLQGRVVGADGVGVAASVQWTAVDLWRPPHPMMDRRSTSADGDGDFALTDGMRRYSMRALAQDGRVGFAVVDASAAPTERFAITVLPAHKVRLSCPPMSLRVAVVTDRDGNPLVVSRLEQRWNEGSISLPDGDYQLTIYDGRGARLGSEALRVAGADLAKELQ